MGPVVNGDDGIGEPESHEPLRALLADGQALVQAVIVACETGLVSTGAREAAQGLTGQA